MRAFATTITSKLIGIQDHAECVDFLNFLLGELAARFSQSADVA